MENDFRLTPEYKEKQRLKKRGCLNPAWKGGVSRNFRKIAPIRQTLVQVCSLCGTTEKLVLHHIDGNYLNNELTNCSIVCRGCHNKIHKSKKVRV